MVGGNIPFRKLGYHTLEDFLDQSPEMCRVSYGNSGIILHGVSTEATAHVASLVARQRKGQKAKPPARRPNNFRPWQPPTPSQPFRGQPHHR